MKKVFTAVLFLVCAVGNVSPAAAFSATAEDAMYKQGGDPVYDSDKVVTYQPEEYYYKACSDMYAVGYTKECGEKVFDDEFLSYGRNSPCRNASLVQKAQKVREALEGLKVTLGAQEFQKMLAAFKRRKRSIDFSNYSFDSSTFFDPLHLFGELYERVHKDQFPYEYFKHYLYEMFEPAGLAFLVDWYIQILDDYDSYADIKHEPATIAKVLFLLERWTSLGEINAVALQLSTCSQLRQANSHVFILLIPLSVVYEKARRATGF